MRPASLSSALVSAVALFALMPTGGYADTLHGYCAGAGQCVDNGTNSPTTNNPPINFGLDRKSTRLNSSHSGESRMPSSA